MLVRVQVFIHPKVEFAQWILALYLRGAIYTVLCLALLKLYLQVACELLVRASGRASSLTSERARAILECNPKQANIPALD